MTNILPIATGLAARDVAEQAHQRLCRSPYFFLRGVQCQFAAGVLTLRGSVPYRQLRQIAESIVGRVEGVEQVVNALQVCDPYAAANGSTRVRTAG